MRSAKGLFKERLELSCPHCGKTVSPFKKPLSVQRLWNALWIALAAAAFVMSFYVPRYFLQFLAAALLFGFKWAIDQKSTRTQIMIYKSLESQTAADTKDLHRLSSKL